MVFLASKLNLAHITHETSNPVNFELNPNNVPKFILTTCIHTPGFVKSELYNGRFHVASRDKNTLSVVMAITNTAINFSVEFTWWQS